MRLGRGFERLTRKSVSPFHAAERVLLSKHGVGQMLSYVMNDVTSVREAISVCLNQTANAVIAPVRPVHDDHRRHSAAADPLLRSPAAAVIPVLVVYLVPPQSPAPETFRMRCHHDRICRGTVRRHPRHPKICGRAHHGRPAFGVTVDRIREGQLLSCG